MEEQRADLLTPALAARYAATFDRDVRATGPQGIHWCLNTPEAPTQELGPDGHPIRADHADLPRRMWASSEMEFHAPIAVGARVERTSRTVDTSEKDGRTGRLLFVTIAHDIRANGVPAISEKQSVVYRAALPKTAAPPPPPPALAAGTWTWERIVDPQPPLLLRYSALTFNSHRIHYDLPYAREEEDYPGLVVHGPLMASLLLDLADRHLGPDALARFAFRGVSPAFAGTPLRLLGRREGQELTMAIATTEGGLIMQASATLR
ncbi:MAG: MaoC family dehydratase N-terminal domain-containing protein [Sphingobium sp.]